jgi:hypothetical protein
MPRVWALAAALPGALQRVSRRRSSTSRASPADKARGAGPSSRVGPGAYECARRTHVHEAGECPAARGAKGT